MISRCKKRWRSILVSKQLSKWVYIYFVLLGSNWRYFWVYRILFPSAWLWILPTHTRRPIILCPRLVNVRCSSICSFYYGYLTWLRISLVDIAGTTTTLSRNITSLPNSTAQVARPSSSPNVATGNGNNNNLGTTRTSNGLRLDIVTHGAIAKVFGLVAGAGILVGFLW